MAKRRSVDPKYSMCVQPSFIIGTNNEDGSANEDIFDIDLTVLDPVIYSGKYHSIGKTLGKIGDFVQ